MDTEFSEIYPKELQITGNITAAIEFVATGPNATSIDVLGSCHFSLGMVIRKLFRIE